MLYLCYNVFNRGDIMKLSVKQIKKLSKRPSVTKVTKKH